LILLLIAALAVASFLWRGFDAAARTSPTFDEGVHIVAGLERLRLGTTETDPINPPLARALIAAPLVLAGERPPAALTEERDANARAARAFLEGNRFLYGRPDPMFPLRLARLQVTIASAIILLSLLAWARARWGGLPGLVALLGAAHAPVLLGHGALATTDAIGGGLFLAALALTARLLERGGLGAALAAGASLAAAPLAKLSTAPALLLALPILVVGLRGREARAALASPLAWLRAHALEVAALALPAPLLAAAVYGTLTPWEPLARALALAAERSQVGSPAYLLGAHATHGWPHYFLVTTLVKAPLGILLGAALALALAWRRRESPLGRDALLLGALALAVLVAAGIGGVDIGHRYVLAVEPLLALTFAAGVGLALLEQKRARCALLAAQAALLAWSVVSVARAHPCEVGYTNAIAGPRPEMWLADSNLDWGQDLPRLAEWQRAQGVPEVRLAFFGSAIPERHGVRARPLAPFERATGWIAVSVTRLLGVYDPPGRREGYAWLRALPEAGRVGTSFVLYRVTEEDLRAMPPPR